MYMHKGLTNHTHEIYAAYAGKGYSLYTFFIFKTSLHSVDLF
jgi:hypothetical protein